MYKRYNGSQIAPCIIAKAKAALGLYTNFKGNSKKCSRKYWVETITIISDKHNLSSEKKQRAYDRYEKYMSLIS